MKVAVQGASGFVGSRLIEWLLLNGNAEVVPIVRSFSSLTRVARFDLDWKLADALDEDALTAAFEGCEIVFLSITGPGPMIVQSPAKTLAAAKKAGVRQIVYISTGVSYGFQPGPDTNDESSALTKQPWPYNRAKALVAEAIPGLREQYGIPIAVVVPTIVFGPRSYSFTTQIARDLLSRQAFLVDGGRGICNTIYVDNLVNAMWLAATLPEAGNETFIVSDAERVTWFELYKSVADEIGVSMDTVHNIARETAEFVIGSRSNWKAQVRKYVRQGPGKRLIEGFSNDFKGHVKGAFQSLKPEPVDRMQSAPQFNPYSLGGEALAVQLCEVQLPIAKARRVLGYDPMSFAEATRRTGAWLRSNGYASDPRLTIAGS